MWNHKTLTCILCLAVMLSILVGCKPEEETWETESSQQESVESTSSESETAQPATEESNSETSTSEEVWTPFV